MIMFGKIASKPDNSEPNLLQTILKDVLDLRYQWRCLFLASNLQQVGNKQRCRRKTTLVSLTPCPPTKV
jgi:hypothetical protein